MQARFARISTADPPVIECSSDGLASRSPILSLPSSHAAKRLTPNRSLLSFPSDAEPVDRGPAGYTLGSDRVEAERPSRNVAGVTV